ncbi:type VI secretion system Vgr family protein [Luteimonas terrae]|uniref:Uncharacterized protein involved in type VI secretion and phage assembly n=1 Tax=Luteimonas terrae TaxID=1530191 RepID=A0ABU1XXA2_9GAMM|nr:uncharacterized protein involved in type VI secretion and phage assembly [Luteimonas terrae]
MDGNSFRFEVLALSAEAHLDLGAMLGAPLLLELLTSDTGYRPFHAHVTACERVGSNGGLARYRLVLEPWLAFLRHRVDSYVLQDMTVMDIVEDVLADYAGAGPLVPAWRWDLADRGIYARRSLTTQYQESDFAFLQRLLAEEGIYTWFEHEGDAASETRGAHTLVLADHADAFLKLRRSHECACICALEIRCTPVSAWDVLGKRGRGAPKNAVPMDEDGFVDPHTTRSPACAVAVHFLTSHNVHYVMFWPVWGRSTASD